MDDTRPLFHLLVAAVSPWLVRCIRLYPLRALSPTQRSFSPFLLASSSNIRVFSVFHTPLVSFFPSSFYRAFLIFPLAQPQHTAHIGCLFFSTFCFSDPSSRCNSIFHPIVPLALPFPSYIRISLVRSSSWRLVAEAENTSAPNSDGVFIVSKELTWLHAHAPGILKRSSEERDPRRKAGPEYRVFQKVDVKLCEHLALDKISEKLLLIVGANINWMTLV